MAISTADKLKSKWFGFKYNFNWSDYVWLLDSGIARYAVFIPIIGYAILFNDQVAQLLKFDQLAGENSIHWGLAGKTRLKFYYLGLTFVAIANVGYFVLRPKVMALGIRGREYVESGLQNFSLQTFANFHDEIYHGGAGHLTMYGDYDSDDWEKFYALATGVDNDATLKVRIVPMSISEKFGGEKKDSSTPKTANWREAKEKYENLLRSILIEIYFRRTSGRRLALVTLMLLASIGYLSLFVPAVDLFAKVTFTIIRDAGDYGLR
jgi:hypothetical protein